MLDTIIFLRFPNNRSIYLPYFRYKIYILLCLHITKDAEKNCSLNLTQKSIWSRDFKIWASLTDVEMSYLMWNKAETFDVSRERLMCDQRMCTPCMYLQAPAQDTLQLNFTRHGHSLSQSSECELPKQRKGEGPLLEGPLTAGKDRILT